jgi:hypothetical protein
MWRKDSRIRPSLAPIFGSVVESLSKDGAIEAADIVKAARHATSPIHSMFTWDDKIAANLHREEQARGYLRALVVLSTNGKELSMPAMISLRGDSGYLATERVMSHDELRERLLAQALAEANSWMQRYKFLRELADIFELVVEKMGRHA